MLKTCQRFQSISKYQSDLVKALGTSKETLCIIKYSNTFNESFEIVGWSKFLRG